MKKNKAEPILKLELAGIVFIVLLGSTLHFTFKLSGGNPLVGVFSAVNESVWEHLKLSFWPALLYAVIEYRYLNRRTGNFFKAKTIGIYLMPLLIVSFFYLYRVFSEENLALDILIFIIAVATGQLASYKVMMRKETSRIYAKISIATLIVLACLFAVFTFYPPHLPLFRDPLSGGYGIKG
ncbi:MAG: DUF6512 family protein [Candidatus Bathyarchaeia archaeon]